MASYQAAQAAYAKMVRRHPSVASYRQGLASSFFNMANLQIEAQRPSEAINSLSEARKVQEGLVRDYPSVVRFEADLAHIHGQTGAILFYQGRTNESLASLAQARRVLLGMVHEHPDVPLYQVDLALTNFYTGQTHKLLSRYKEALNSFEQTCDALGELDRVNAIDLRTRHVLASAWEEIGDVLTSMGRLRDSTFAYAQATSHQARAYDLSSTDRSLNRKYAMQLEIQFEKLAAAQVSMNRPAEARVALLRAREILMTLSDPSPADSYDQARVCSHLYAVLCKKPGALTAAQQAEQRTLIDQALDGLRRAVLGRHTDIVRLQTDKNFDSLRSISEFQVFMSNPAFPANPFAR